MPMNYNAGTTVDPSAVDVAGQEQLKTFHHIKRALIDAKEEQFFLPLSTAVEMPKNSGKAVKVYQYIPLLDDRNINDQGIDAQGVTTANGNIYGSSKDIGVITSKLPVLTENGERVNRVGFTRQVRTGAIQELGFFYEFSADALQFDTDEQLAQHLADETIKAAHKMTEAVLQIELLNAAGTEVFSGAAVDDDEITGEVAGAVPASIVTYEDLMRLDQTLTDNRTPKKTKVITGSRLVDTKTIPSARLMYIGSELVPIIRGMKDLFNNQAFIPVQQYAAGNDVMNGEIGTVDSFRIIVVPDMLHWAGVGAAVGTNPGYRATGGKYDVYPMLVIGDDSFVTIGFTSDGASAKFNIMTKKPGREMATRADPYGKLGFSSIQWWYGTLIKRPERIGLIKTVAPI